MKKKPGPVISLIIGALMLGLGYFLSFHFGLELIRNGRASLEWPSTSAEIISSEVIRERKRKTGDSGSTKTMYSPEVIYTYTVDGRTYESSNISFGGVSGSSNSATAYKVVKHYPKGKTVQAFYNPEEPEMATLETGTQITTYLPFGIGLLFMGFGLLLFLKPVLAIALLLRP